MTHVYPDDHQPEMRHTDPMPDEVFAFPASFAQQRLWFLDQFAPGSPAYNLPAAMHLTGTLDRDILAQSINVVIERHESLRTTFIYESDQLLQIITPTLTVPLHIVDLSDATLSPNDVEVKQRIVTEARHSFDLARGPLIHAVLLAIGETEHILLVVLHHIIADAWSRGVFVAELTAVYSALKAGDAPSLPPLPLQYADFAVWQREWLEGSVRSTQLDYWKQQLAGMPTALTLPTSQTRPAVQTMHGASHAFVIPTSQLTALRALSQQCGTTLFMTLLAVFQTLLYRYTGQTDIVVGTPVANRSARQTESLIGIFINTLVLRTQLSGNPSFRELLSRVRRVALDGYANQELPFELLVEALQPERNLSYSPLVQVMFILRSVPISTTSLSTLTTQLLEIDNGTAQYDLTLAIDETEQQLRSVLEYNSDLFDATTIARMAEHFQTLLTAIVDDPEQKIAALPLLTVAEQQSLADWNATTAPYAAEASIHSLVELQAEQTPDNIAVMFGSETLTYAELDQHARLVAHQLQVLGVGPETRVGVYMDRSLELIVALLGTLKAGGAYVPLDPVYPQERLAFMLEDSGIEVLLTQRSLLESLPSHRATTICLNLHEELPVEAEPQDLDVAVLPDNIAYVIYTSGSTGTPKGVQVPHGAVVNFLQAMQRQIEITAEDTVLAITTLAFDIAVLELFLPLTVGARVVLASHAQGSDGAKLAELAIATNTTIMQATPATWSLLVEAGWHGQQQLKILCGGEILPRKLADQLYERGSSVWNMYGPTETTVWSTSALVDQTEGPISIGRPIANTQIYLLDQQFQAVPVGIPGELCIGGSGLARGYLHRPALTAERFIPNPFSAQPDARLYRTGDLARYQADGSIQILGRIDHQVKLRGFRIELDEIAAVLSQHQDVREAVVITREMMPGDQRLVAYTVANQGAVLAISDLRSFLKRKLPEYMIPSVFMVVDELARTPNGKIDRKALPQPEGLRPELSTAYLAPKSHWERNIAAIWQEMLGLEKVGVHDNFFDLGGHSLLMVQIRNKLRTELDLDLSMIDLFTNPTISLMVQHINQRQRQTDLFTETAEQIEARSEQTRQRRQRRQALWAEEFTQGGEDEG